MHVWNTLAQNPDLARQDFDADVPTGSQSTSQKRQLASDSVDSLSHPAKRPRGSRTKSKKQRRHEKSEFRAAALLEGKHFTCPMPGGCKSLLFDKNGVIDHM